MSLTAAASPWTEAALGFLYPPVCQLCNDARAGAEDGFICTPCFHRVRFIKPPVCDRCGLPYEGDINTTFTCANCAGVELHFTTARSAVVATNGPGGHSPLQIQPRPLV